MITKTFRCGLLASTVFAGAVIASPAIAQQAPAADVPIVVTGSRIPQPNLTSISPVTVIGAQDVKLQGVTRSEDLVNALPQVFAAQGSQVSNGATGSATVDLRGLGPSRTLVLVNGRRLMPGNVGSSAADLNFVPSALIKRVDVLTGGAGSVYGSDAISGVVNFILDREYQGFKIDGQYSLYQHGNKAASDITTALNNRNFGYPSGNNVDGGEVQASATFGAGFDDHRGHVTAYFTYDKSNEVVQANRDYSACNLAGTPGAFSCGGSSTSATGRFFLDDGSSYTVQGNQLVPWSSAKYAYNFGPTNYYHRPDERFTFGAFADYKVSDAIQPYMELMFMNDRSVAQIAPSGDFGNTLTVPCDNPFLSAQELSIVCSVANTTAAGYGTVTRPNGAVVQLAGLQILRRNIEGGPRQSDLEHTDFRVVLGTKGDLGHGWSYDAAFQYGKIVFANTYLNDLSVIRLGRALDVTTSGGQPVCASKLDGTDPNCVPWNVFANGGVTSAAAGYLGVPGLNRGNQQQSIFQASVTGDLGQYGFKSPLAKDGLKINFGFEYRRDSGFLQPDQEFATGDLSGQGGPTTPLSGFISATEFFGEASLPLITDHAFFESLRLEGSVRHSNFKNSVNSTSADSWKVGGEWRPVRDIMFRASYNNSVRAPNIGELYSPQSVSLDGSTDPCAGAAVAGLVNGFTAAQCALTGVTAAQFGNIAPNSANQYNGQSGGNPLLNPEKGTTFTAGVVLTPRMIPGFSLTVDYFNIKIKNLISTVGADLLLQQCLTSSLFCNTIHRDQFGSLWRTSNGFVQDTLLNAGTEFTKGYDIAVRYQHALGSGKIGAELIGTLLDSNGFKPVGGNAIDCVKHFGPPNCGVPTPDWRHKARLTWFSNSGFSLSAAWRYYAPVTNGTYRIPPQSYVDLTGTVKVADKYGFRIGVQNLFDRDPPIVGSQALSGTFGNGNTYPQVYDALGRYIFAGVSLEF